MDYLKNYKQTAEKFNQISQKSKKTAASQTHFGCINMGSIMGQICTASVLQPFLSDFLQMEHPVLSAKYHMLLANHE